ncbi:MAG: hypothetical protein ACOCG5_09190 [Candidatus Alkaliphilus sp. MAG34]
MKNVILSEAKDLKWPKNEILRYTQNDKKREKCFFTQSDITLAYYTITWFYIPVYIGFKENILEKTK